MAQLPVKGVRLDPAEVARVYEARPELAGADLSRVLRIGLAVLAGNTVDDAIRAIPRRKRGYGSPIAERNRAKAGAAA
jgi:hypothetical protein